MNRVLSRDGTRIARQPTRSSGGALALETSRLKRKDMMRFIAMHRTDERWEAGLPPGEELVARVGAMIGAMTQAGIFVAGEGLRASSLGVRLSFSEGKRRITRGPFRASDVLPSGFLILRVSSIDDAIEWSTRLGQVLGNAQIELRPVTEPWELGMAPRPPDVTTRRFMALVKDATSEAGEKGSAERQGLRARLLDRMRESGALLATVSMRPSARGARCRRDGDGYALTDGPFAESKELIAGYVVMDVASKEEAIKWMHLYAAGVDSGEVDLRELA